MMIFHYGYIPFSVLDRCKLDINIMTEIIIQKFHDLFHVPKDLKIECYHDNFDVICTKVPTINTTYVPHMNQIK